MVPQRLRDRKASRKRQIRQSLRRQRSQGFILLTNFKSPKQIRFSSTLESSNWTIKITEQICVIIIIFHLFGFCRVNSWLHWRLFLRSSLRSIEFTTSWGGRWRFSSACSTRTCFVSTVGFMTRSASIWFSNMLTMGSFTRSLAKKGILMRSRLQR